MQPEMVCSNKIENRTQNKTVDKLLFQFLPKLPKQMSGKSPLAENKNIK